MDASELIDRLGGPAALAARLGYTNPGAAARVCNWRRRGIPPRVLLDHLEIFRAARDARPATEPARP